MGKIKMHEKLKLWSKKVIFLKYYFSLFYCNNKKLFNVLNICTATFNTGSSGIEDE